ncbi:MAG TPA: hypothetical protein VFF07_16930 [Actinomycetota bacterium]|nr:hypothetical protein [Actinomycetota bacterium]
MCSGNCLVVTFVPFVPFVLTLVVGAALFTTTLVVLAGTGFIAAVPAVPTRVPIPLTVPVALTISVALTVPVPATVALTVACGLLGRRLLGRRGLLGSDIDARFRRSHNGLSSSRLPFARCVLVTWGVVVVTAFLPRLPPSPAISTTRAVAVLSTAGLDDGFLRALL